MADKENAAPICRGKNLTLETVLSFVNAMPTEVMEKSQFHSIAESKMKGWTTTHSQIARQLALYYEDEHGLCHPRFTWDFTMLDVFNYIKHWAMLYFIPNPYTPSLRGKKKTNIYAFLKQKAIEGVTSYSDACNSIYGIELSSLDKVRVYLNNFTDLVICDNVLNINEHLSLNEYVDVYPNIGELDNKSYFDYFQTKIECIRNKFSLIRKKYPLQQITYGAPGTGKSYGLNDIIDSMDHFRTTFHPDSDYASFVGAYKPTMSKVSLSNGYNTLDEGNKVEEEQITYKFVPQSFIKAYVSAWKNYKEDKPTVLVIEEINRGNCAQIFGDLFQLLDRGSNGFSSYPIEADADVANYLNGEMPNLTECAESIDTLFAKSYPEGIATKIKSGDLLLLPNNLYIWATMNTSDQSLFPIDSAFKRRWDWKFIKIADARKGWFIKFGNEGCDWWTFISKMNKLIAKETSSDDKKMGYFFCKPQSEDEKVITEDQFVGKVLFYLWNDVFKDGDTALFKVSDDTDDEPTFETFYNDDNTPNMEAIRKFIVKVVGEENIKSPEAAAEEQADETKAE